MIVMKTKSFALALTAAALAFTFVPSQAQAGGRRDCDRNDYRRDNGYNNYGRGYRGVSWNNDCYAPVYRPVRVVRRAPVYVPAPAFQISFGFGGGGCR